LDGDGQDPALRILETRHQPVTVGIEVGLRAVGENLERRKQRILGFDDAAAGSRRRRSSGFRGTSSSNDP
jgi:hypothetical protein